MKPVHLLLLLAFFIAFPANSLADDAKQAIPDSLLTDEYMVEIYMDDPGLAQEILDTIRERKLNIPEHRLDYIQACIYWRIDQHHLAIYYWERCLQYYDETGAKTSQINTMNAILSSALQCDDYDKIIKYAHRMIELSEDDDSDVSKGNLASAYYHLGSMYWNLSQFNKGIDYFDKALAILNNIDETIYQEFLADYTINISLLFQYTNNFDRAMRYNQLLYDTIERLEKKPESVDGVMQQYPIMYSILMANTLAGLKRTGEADAYYEKFMSFPEDDRRYLGNYIDIYLYENGKYRESISLQEEKLQDYRVAGDTINGNVMGLKRNMAKAYQKLREYDRAALYYQDVITVKDSLFYREKRNNIHEFAIIHDVWGKENEIQEQRTSIRIRNIFLLSVSIIVILLIILLIRHIQNQRRLNEKNKGLVKRIQEQDFLYNKMEEERKELEKLRGLLKETAGTTATEEEKDELYDALVKLMDEKQPYTDSGLNRKLLASALATNEKYLRETIKKHFDMTVNEYITSLRLKHSKNLLLMPAERYTVEAVAFDSGFGSRSTFHALFREQYGLTPDEFRRFAVG